MVTSSITTSYPSLFGGWLLPRKEVTVIEIKLAGCPAREISAKQINAVYFKHQQLMQRSGGAEAGVGVSENPTART